MMAQEVGGGVSVVGSIGEGGSDGEKCRMAGGGVVGNRGGIGLRDLPRSGLVQARLYVRFRENPGQIGPFSAP